MKRCAFLSTDNLEDFFVYDRLLIEPLAERGWQAEEISWHRTDVDWNQYDVVLIRSTWDYQQQPQAFIRCLQDIERSSAQLSNSLATVQWNINKDYLQFLEKQGVAIVPTLWLNGYEEAKVAAAFGNFDSEWLVLKPQLSANADDTFRFNREKLPQLTPAFNQLFNARACMLQPFVRDIVDTGEYSLFYFDGEYSHSILKTPKAEDFRVQEEHGGQLKLINATAEMLAVGAQTLKALPELPMYARVDLVQLDTGLAVMEVELIEPSLYFNMQQASVPRFADAFVRRYGAGE